MEGKGERWVVFMKSSPFSNSNECPVGWMKIGGGVRWKCWDTVVYWFAHNWENLSSILS